MMHEIIQKFKVQITLKELLLWFGLSFVGVFAIYLSVFHKELNSLLFIEVFAYALVFVLIMAMTKSYGHFVDEYYQAHIDRQTSKPKNKKVYKNKKKR